jgi:hypothetical protein
MTPEEQNTYLLKLLDRFHFELGVYLVLVEYAKLAVGAEHIDKLARDARKNPTLRAHAQASIEGVEASLHLSHGNDPDQVLREFLAQFGSKEKPN